MLKYEILEKLHSNCNFEKQRSPVGGGGAYKSLLTLNEACLEELQWCKAHFNAWNDRTILTPHPDLVIETDATKLGWGAICKDLKIGGLW